MTLYHSITRHWRSWIYLKTTFIHFEKCQMTSVQLTHISYIIYKDHIDIHIYLGMLFPNVFQCFFWVYHFSWITKKRITDKLGQKSPQKTTACHSKTSGGAAHITSSGFLTQDRPGNDRFQNQSNSRLSIYSCVWIPIICVYYIYVSVVD